MGNLPFRGEVHKGGKKVCDSTGCYVTDLIPRLKHFGMFTVPNEVDPETLPVGSECQLVFDDGRTLQVRVTDVDRFQDGTWQLQFRSHEQFMGETP
jgi:hypothetical protein